MGILNGYLPETSTLKPAAPFNALDEVESGMLMEFACAVAPGLVQFSMHQVPTLAGGLSNVLSAGTLSSLSFQAAGVMLAEWKKRVAGEIPTHGVNVPLDWKPPQAKEE